MRNVARLKIGSYPLPEPEEAKLRSLLFFTGPASAIDPCVGPGIALHLATSDAQVRRYGVELDAEHARIASANGITWLPGTSQPLSIKRSAMIRWSWTLRHSFASRIVY